MPEVVTITAEMRAMKPAAMELAAMEAANAAGSERATMEAAAAEPAAVGTPATAVETAATVETSAAAATVETSATATAVGTSTSAMSVGGIWLAERCNAQQSKGGGCQSPSCAGASFLFAELLHRRLLLHGPPTGHL
jgi:hypothetical protein